MNQTQNDTLPKKRGRKATGRAKKSLTVYLAPEVYAWLHSTKCASQIVEDLVRQEMPTKTNT